MLPTVEVLAADYNVAPNSVDSIFSWPAQIFLARQLVKQSAAPIKSRNMESAMNSETVHSKPYITGRVMPVGKDRQPETRMEPLFPPEVKRVSVSLDIPDYTKEGVEGAIVRFPACVDHLIAQGAQRIMIAGLPVSSQLGRARVLKLIEETERRTGVPVDGQGESTAAALKHLGARRITIASRWSDELNNALVRYLTEAGMEVLAVTTRGQWAQQAFSMSFDEGVRLSFQLGREALRLAPQAEGLLIAGGAWRSLAAVPILEADFGIPVVTNPISEIWRLMQAGIAPPVKHWGRLLGGE
jgi:arylmalonate decarboxylase